MEWSSRSERSCAGHDAVIEGESPLWDLSEVTMSERQLHEPIRVTEVAESGFAVRSCEMEACSELQHRTKVNLQAGMLTWASDSISLQLERIDESSFLLSSGGFHWIQYSRFFR